MRQQDRLDEVRRRASEYRRYKDDISDYKASIECGLHARAENLSGVSGTKVSDPTAVQAIARMEVPKRIREEMAWVAAIESAWAEMHSMDGGVECGMTYIFENTFNLIDEESARTSDELMEFCEIPRTTYFSRVKVALDILLFHAARANLLN